MSTPSFKYGNGVWATKEGSSLAYNDDNGHYKPLPFSVSRASSATRVNKQGLIEVVGNDRLRIDYSESANGVALLEPSRTNLYVYSEDFSQSTWTKSSLTATLTSEIAPDGSTDSVYNIAGTNANLYTGGTSGVEHTISFYIKSNGQGKDKFKLRLGNNASEEFTATTEWVRYSFTSTPATAVFGITTSSAPNNEFDLLVWGAQSEQASYATSYIPTSGSTATRQADVANGAGVANVFNDSEGVLFADIAALANDGTNRYISMNDGTTSNRVNIFIDSANTLRGYISGISSIPTSAKITQNNKVAFKYKSGDIDLWVNGFVGASSTSTFTLSGLKSVNFDQTGIYSWYGKAKGINVYQTALTDAELEYLTSYRSLAEMVTELNLNAL